MTYYLTLQEFEFDSPVKILDKLLHAMCAFWHCLCVPFTFPSFPFLVFPCQLYSIGSS